MPDADSFGDRGSNTLKSIFRSPEYRTSNLEQMGLFNIEGVEILEGRLMPDHIHMLVSVYVFILLFICLAPLNRVSTLSFLHYTTPIKYTELIFSRLFKVKAEPVFLNILMGIRAFLNIKHDIVTRPESFFIKEFLDIRVMQITLIPERFPQIAYRLNIADAFREVYGPEPGAVIEEPIRQYDSSTP